MRQAEETLDSARSFWVELPQAKGSAFARLDSMNQHDLHYHNQIKISLEEILNAALQYRHVLGRTPAQPSTTLILHSFDSYVTEDHGERDTRFVLYVIAKHKDGG